MIFLLLVPRDGRTVKHRGLSHFLKDSCSVGFREELLLGKMVEMVVSFLCFGDGEESNQQRGYILRGARLKVRKLINVRATGYKSNNVEV